jgi:hypothetical protein
MNRPDQLNDKQVQLVIYEILQYLIENPDAQDTQEGIANWWLLDRTIEHKTALVKEALKRLVKDRLVIKQERSDSRTDYKMNRRRRKKIISLLQQRDRK